MSKDLFGGMKIIRKPYVEFIDRLTIIKPQILKILNSSFKILLEDIQIQTLQDHLIIKRKEFYFENKYPYYINTSLQH